MSIADFLWASGFMIGLVASYHFWEFIGKIIYKKIYKKLDRD